MPASGRARVPQLTRVRWQEVGFFYRWWLEQDAAMQARFARLVRSGQLEFINGGWTMNDESGVSDEDMLVCVCACACAVARFLTCSSA